MVPEPRNELETSVPKPSLLFVGHCFVPIITSACYIAAHLWLVFSAAESSPYILSHSDGQRNHIRIHTGGWETLHPLSAKWVLSCHHTTHRAEPTARPDQSASIVDPLLCIYHKWDVFNMDWHPPVIIQCLGCHQLVHYCQQPSINRPAEWGMSLEPGAVAS